jgi:6-phosphogluconolactonase
MTDPCLIELLEHRCLADAAEVAASEAADWLGYRVLGDAVSAAFPGDCAPRAMLEAIADVPIAWDRVTVTTTDEHCVPEHDRLSNIGAVRRAFRGRWGSRARFVSLDRPNAASHVKLPLDLVILSLDAHGRIACLPPCSARSVEAAEPLVDYMHRPSMIERPVAARRWTLSALVSSQRTLLISAGRPSRTAIDRALETGDGGPLGAWFGRARGIVTIHWAEA